MTNDTLPAEISSSVQRLFPLTRSLTGTGNRDTLRVLQEIAPIELNEYSTDPLVYDWVIPDGWSIRDVFIKGPCGNRLEPAS